MPIEYDVDTSRSRLVTRVRGVVTDADTLEYMQMLLSDPEYRSGMDGLVFTDEIERLEVTSGAIEQAATLATRDEHRFSGSRWAIVASQDPVFGMTRMYELRRDANTYVVRAFRELDQALEWLEGRLPSGAP